MSVLKRRAARMHLMRSPKPDSAEALGLSLIQARALYDAWREDPRANNVRIVRLAAGVPVDAGIRYVMLNRAKWESFNAQATSEREPPLESKLQAKFMRLCRSRGWIAYKAEAPGFAGLPDVQVLQRTTCPGSERGRIAFVEMKRPGRRPTKLQEHVITELQTMGFDAFWADDPYEAFDTLSQIWGIPR